MKNYCCLICGGPSLLIDVVDFNKNCEEARGLYLPLMGHGVYYVRCSVCNYTYAPEFGSWSSQDFLGMIYNNDYQEVDPDYLTARPEKNAEALNRIFCENLNEIVHLDYGGGNGKLSDLLRHSNWNSRSYDPFPDDVPMDFNAGTFNLITVFEVFEHVPNPLTMMDNIVKALSPAHGIVLFSTLASDGFIKQNERLTWWYVAPRNGHIGIHSLKSLQILGERFGLEFRSLSPGVHAYFKILPDWAKNVFTT